MFRCNKNEFLNKIVFLCNFIFAATLAQYFTELTYKSGSI